MGQKDLTQKNLETYPDVFADTVNALLYEGESILMEENLCPAPTETLYYGEDANLRNQFHDVSKYETQAGKVIAQYTLENETRCDSKMILRKAGYEGAVYREQYEKKMKDIYPVVSLVLHWGKRRWHAPKSIHSLFERKNISEKLMRYIDNMQIYAYDMRYLSKEVRQRFASDMRLVVDYLAEGEDYQPTDQPIKHIEAFLLMMRQITGDCRYEEIIEEVVKEHNEKGEMTMCPLLDKYEARGVQKGTVMAIKNIMQNMKMTAEQAMEVLEVPLSERAEYLQLIKEG